ncbi:hypothetical protein V6N13_128875 [Hibiscus sabdariffa]
MQLQAQKLIYTETHTITPTLKNSIIKAPALTMLPVLSPFSHDDHHRRHHRRIQLEIGVHMISLDLSATLAPPWTLVQGNGLSESLANRTEYLSTALMRIGKILLRCEQSTDEVIEEGVDQVVGLRWAAVIEEMLGTTHELCGLVGDTTMAATYPFHSEDLEVAPNQPVGFRLREASNGNKVLISGPEGVAIGSATSCPIHSEDLDVVSPKQPVGSKVGEGSDTNNGKIAEIMD